MAHQEEVGCLYKALTSLANRPFPHSTPTPRHPVEVLRTRVHWFCSRSSEVLCLGWKDEEGVVGCWQASPTSWHMAGSLKKGGPMSCDSAEVQTSVVRASPSPYVLGTPSFSSGGMCVRDWDMTRGFLTLVFLPQVAYKSRTPPPAVALGTQEALSSR